MKPRIVAAVDDMFFAAKIRATAEAVGTEIEFARNTEKLFEAASREPPPALAIINLHAQSFDPFAAAEKLKADPHTSDVQLLGFFSHVQTELKQRAEQAGFERILPRSAFANHLASILRGEDKA